MHRVGFAAAAALLGTVWLANVLVETYGVVPVGFGLMAPAAVYVVGVAFTLRDVVHRTLGRHAVVAAIVAGAALSYLVAPAFAVASGVAFLVSEAADLLVYEPLSRRSWVGAVAVSNTVGVVVDSLLFLWLAFGSLEFLPGQIVGKMWMTAAAVLVLLAGQRAVLARYARA